MDRRAKDGGDILTEALWRSERARFPVRKDGESEDRKGSGIDSLGQFRVFRRDVPDACAGAPH
jgi:hypothetical protein